MDTDRGLPEAVLIVIYQMEWDDRKRQEVDLCAKMSYLESLAGEGLSEAAYYANLEAWCDCDELLVQIQGDMKEIEDWLIDHSAPGWVAT